VSETPEQLAVAFANTVYAVRGRRGDAIEAEEGLLAFLGEHREALGEPLASADAETVAEVQELRDAVRALFAAAVEGADPPAEALALLNETSVAAPVAVTLDWQGGQRGLRVRQAESDRAACTRAQLAAATAALLGGPLGPALRACEGPRCVQYLLQDLPRRSFCSDACSTRARAARYYARHRGRA
jgi:predicted RNA-binding Zn ribbon-like protein